jgi:hypothetical protein
MLIYTGKKMGAKKWGGGNFLGKKVFQFFSSCLNEHYSNFFLHILVKKVFLGAKFFYEKISSEKFLGKNIGSTVYVYHFLYT